MMNIEQGMKNDEGKLEVRKVRNGKDEVQNAKCQLLIANDVRERSER